MDGVVVMAFRECEGGIQGTVLMHDVNLMVVAELMVRNKDLRTIMALAAVYMASARGNWEHKEDLPDFLIDMIRQLESGADGK